jgi:hypothetical protein
MSAAENIPLEDIPSPSAANEVDDRPTVQITIELHEVTDEAIRTLQRDPNLYERNGSLVRVHRAEAPKRGKRAPLVEGSPAIDKLPFASLRERMTKAAVFERYDKRANDGKGAWQRCSPSPMLVESVYARGHWPGIPRLAGILEAPSLRPDGSLIQSPGYDAATGYLYVPNLSFPTVAARPTQADAQAALAELADVFVDFPFRDDAARYVPIAALLTLLARPAILGSVPGFVVDAATPGTGKTLSLDAVAIIATGRSAGRMTFPEGRNRNEELEKVLASFALQGAALINFDNVSDAFGGDALNKVLTSTDTVDFRVLGKSEVVSVVWRAVVVASGNNVYVQGDTSRRMLTARLESPLENPEERTGFQHSNLLAWVSAHRARLVCAALTVLRAFVVADRPRGGCAEWGSFEAWAALVPPAIVFAGGANVLDARVTASSIVEDPDRAAHRIIIADLPRLDHAGRGMKTADIIAALYPPERQRGQPCPPDGFDDLREALENMTNTPPGKVPGAKQVGNQLRRFLKRVVGGKMLASQLDRKGIVLWSVQ